MAICGIAGLHYTTTQCERFDNLRLLVLKVIHITATCVESMPPLTGGPLRQLRSFQVALVAHAGTPLY